MTLPEMNRIYQGKMEDVLPQFAENTFSSVVTDPPYELGFMGKKWDSSGVAFRPETWASVLRVMKPGAHLLAFGGTRTYHRMVCAIEDAGFEVRDMVSWIYGCLSDDTEILVDGRWEQYHKAIEGCRALCYNVGTDEFSWLPIQDRFVYAYDDTAYRVASDHTDQIVSRNHRCVVEQGGARTFMVAEEAAREREVRVPVLEDVRRLLQDLPVPDERAGHKEQGVFTSMREGAYRAGEQRQGADGAAAWRPAGIVRRLREVVLALLVPSETRTAGVLLEEVQRQGSRPGVGEARAQRIRSEDARGAGELSSQDVWTEQPGMEGRRDVLQEARELCGDQICEVPARVRCDGEEGRVCDGAPTDRGSCGRATVVADGSRPSRRPQPAEQRQEEPATLRQQQGPQAVRGSRYARADLARVEPIHYTGTVWCVRVPTGAFVARRNGKMFITGNSGFPKSLNISKAIDKAAQAVRQIVGAPTKGGKGQGNAYGKITRPPATAPATAWDGWGTALKPALEPICLARKPISEKNVAANVLKWGTGAINIDASRIGLGDGGERDGEASAERRYPDNGGTDFAMKPGPRGGDAAGRWPANVLLDPYAAGYLDAQTGSLVSGMPVGVKAGGQGNAFGHFAGGIPVTGFGDSGGASRFFYCAKPDQAERDMGMEKFSMVPGGIATGRKEGSAGLKSPRAGAGAGGKNKNFHPTVKPIALIAYLIQLVTPRGGALLDPFLGSGTTAIAATRLGFDWVGIEMEADHIPIAEARVAAERNGRLI